MRRLILLLLTLSVLAGGCGTDEPERVAFAIPRAAGVSDEASQTRQEGLTVYLMNGDGSELAPLTYLTEDHGFPAWSPDGSRIAFVSQRGEERDGEIWGGETDIYVVDADGSGLTLLTGDPQVTAASFPSWSPDGSQIAFSLEREDNIDIYIVGADGSGLGRLTDDSAQDFLPVWSPDGTRIAFMSDRDSDGFGIFEIYVIGSDGADLVRLTDDEDNDWFPVWSPDGTEIAWFAGVEVDSGFFSFTVRGDIFVANADGSDRRNVTNLDFEIFPFVDFLPPVWSPDGTRLVLGVPWVRGSEIYVANVDGSSGELLTTNCYCVAPVWSRDGSQIFYLSDPDGFDSFGEDVVLDVHVMNSDGSNPQRLTHIADTLCEDCSVNGIPSWIAVSP